MKLAPLQQLLINGLPVQVRGKIDIECHATQKYREEECQHTSMGVHCLKCNSMKS